MKTINRSRRQFMKGAGALALGSTLPVSLVELAFAESSQNFSFAYISDAHIQHIKDNRFVRNWDRGLIRAVAETNLLVPKPDFVVFGGDLAQLGNKPELDHGAEIMSGLQYKVHYVMGEHDYYLDLGEYWEKLFGPQYYSFDHKGVHFIVLNSIVTYDEWTYNRWPTNEQRMLEMAMLDNPNGSPFMVGAEQLLWLKKDLSMIDNNTPIVVFVIYGHVHQVQYNQIGHISFNSVMATAWPWPYPPSYAHAEQYLPKLIVPMNRADPFFERDGTGWQLINSVNGNVDMEYLLYSNRGRSVRYHREANRPEDTDYQHETMRIPPQSHY
jgi:Icc protein